MLHENNHTTLRNNGASCAISGDHMANYPISGIHYNNEENIDMKS